MHNLIKYPIFSTIIVRYFPKLYLNFSPANYNPNDFNQEY